MSIKKGDFIEIDFVGRIKDNNQIFDLTKEDIAKKEGIHNPKANYKAQIVCVGEGDVVKGLDAFFVGKEVKKDYTLELSPEEAFGKKNPQLMKMMPLSTFKKEKMNPYPGMQLNLDGMLATVRSVSGGRVMLDFNHPLAGRDLSYEITINKVITNDEEKLKSMLASVLGKEIECSVKAGKAEITTDLPEQIQTQLKTEVQKRIPSIKDITFLKKEK